VLEAQFSRFRRADGHGQQMRYQTTLRHDVRGNSPHLALRAAMCVGNELGVAKKS